MSGDHALQRCDECGRNMVRAQRVHNEHRYCATCYPRIFKRTMCPKCGNLARLPKTDPSAVCRTCENDKPCARCGRTRYTIGKVTPYGPVCNACAPHYRMPEPCEVCGAHSPRLTRVSRLGHDRRVCPTCAGAYRGTCTACSRYRLLMEAADGRALCKTCLEKGEVPCPKCQQPMPAGYGTQCQRCYWKALLEKRIQIDCAAFSSPEMAAHFGTFGAWLGQTVGEHKAALTIHRYLPFFTDIERQWRTIPNYGELLAHFGAATLRQVLLPMRWMEATGSVVPDEAAKAEDSDRRRIAATLGKLNEGSTGRVILEGYYGVLLASLKAGTTTVRSIRLALSPAAALLLMAGRAERMPPDQSLLGAYLTNAPGQRAAMSGFVGYLREKHGADLVLPKAALDIAQRKRRKRLEAELLALMREGGEGDEFKRRWLSVALAYFHGLPMKVGKMVGDDGVSPSGGGMVVAWANRKYWLPILTAEVGVSRLGGSPHALSDVRGNFVRTETDLDHRQVEI